MTARKDGVHVGYGHARLVRGSEHFSVELGWINVMLDFNHEKMAWKKLVCLP